MHRHGKSAVEQAVDSSCKSLPRAMSGRSLGRSVAVRPDVTNSELSYVHAVGRSRYGVDVDARQRGVMTRARDAPRYFHRSDRSRRASMSLAVAFKGAGGPRTDTPSGGDRGPGRAVSTATVRSDSERPAAASCD